MRLTGAAEAWGTTKFREVLKEEIEQQVGRESLLQRALLNGNFIADERPTVMINSIEDQGDHVAVRVGLFFAGINAGACCADDPTPVESHFEYCVVQMQVDLATGETQARVIDQ
jgi:ribosomal protein L10